MSNDNIITFPHTDNWRNHLKTNERQIKDGTLRTRTFCGYPKVDGSNHSIHRMKDGRIMYFGRSAEIIEKRDPFSFKLFADERIETFKSLFNLIEECDSRAKGARIIIYGEFAGKKIQKAAAVQELERFFYIFGIQIISSGGNHWFDMVKHNVDIGSKYRIWPKTIFPQYHVTIDYTDLDGSEKRLNELTALVNRECPVAKFLAAIDGHVLKKTIGEGIVWSAVTNDPIAFSSAFKTKGPEFLPRKCPKRDKKEIEASHMEIIDEFVEDNVTDIRCEQGIHYLKEADLPVDRSSLNEFAKWVAADAIREEGDDLLVPLGNLNRALIKAAIAWFNNRVTTSSTSSASTSSL
jgi:hypothetical protein